MKKHLLTDYPPRSTACGLYYPEELFTEGFGTYLAKDGVTCKRCLRSLEAKREHDIAKKYGEARRDDIK